MALLIKILEIASLALSIYILIIVVAAVITWVSPDPRNPVVQFLFRVTNPALMQVRRRFPTHYSGIDIAPLILILGIMFVQQVIIRGAIALLAGLPPTIILVLVLLFIRSVLVIYMWIAIAAAVISWVNPDPRNPIVRVLYSITEPVFYRIRRLVPTSFGGIDIAPMLLIFAILILMYVVIDGLIGILGGGAAVWR
ncbi:MAG: YggT family protein [Desulfarculaceae bacterium]|jgi:YggT family protein